MNSKIKEALEKLKAGNARFIKGTFAADNSQKRRQELLQGQHPFATVLTCSDSRVVPEYIFDQGLGNLFIIRTAGEVLDDIAIASLEYGAEHLETPIVVVLGHTLCGAVNTMISKAEVHGHLTKLIDKIKPALQACENYDPTETGKELENDVIRENVLEIAESLPRNSDLIRHQVEKGKVAIIGAIYSLEEGKVEFLIDAKSHLSENPKK
jgi:carbonic anhydrase